MYIQLDTNRIMNKNDLEDFGNAIDYGMDIHKHPDPETAFANLCEMIEHNQYRHPHAYIEQRRRTLDRLAALIYEPERVVIDVEPDLFWKASPRNLTSAIAISTQNKRCNWIVQPYDPPYASDITSGLLSTQIDIDSRQFIDKLLVAAELQREGRGTYMRVYIGFAADNT